MNGFELVWNTIAKAREGESVSSDLKPLLHHVHDEVSAAKVCLPVLKARLVELLQFLCGEGRTNANCWATDLFFCSDDWERDWAEQDLPEDFHAVFARMGEALHDTVSSPDVAENFGCLPQQLLECAERLRI